MMYVIIALIIISWITRTLSEGLIVRTLEEIRDQFKQDK